MNQLLWENESNYSDAFVGHSQMIFHRKVQSGVLSSNERELYKDLALGSSRIDNENKIISHTLEPRIQIFGCHKDRHLIVSIDIFIKTNTW